MIYYIATALKEGKVVTEYFKEDKERGMEFVKEHPEYKLSPKAVKVEKENEESR